MSLEKKIRKTPEFSTMYHAQINNISTASKQKSNKKEAPNISEIMNYLPHHTILNVNKPGKLGLSLMHLSKCETIRHRFVTYTLRLIYGLLDHIMLVCVFGEIYFPCCTNWSLRELPH